MFGIYFSPFLFNGILRVHLQHGNPESVDDLVSRGKNMEEVKQCHESVHHSGLRATLAEVRPLYWIRKVDSEKNFSKCTLCKTLEGNAFSTPPEADLSGFRLKESAPFSTVSVDFAGPLFVRKEGDQMAKVYIALFTSSVTRAVHRDMVEDMSAPTFLRCF